MNSANNATLLVFAGMILGGAFPALLTNNPNPGGIFCLVMMIVCALGLVRLVQPANSDTQELSGLGNSDTTNGVNAGEVPQHSQRLSTDNATKIDDTFDVHRSHSKSIQKE